AQVGPALEQVRGERVPELVGADVALDAGDPGDLAQALEEALPGHAAAEAGQEDRLARPRRPVAVAEQTAGLEQVALDPPPRHLTERHDALLAPLAEHPQEARLEVQVAEPQLHQLA